MLFVNTFVYCPEISHATYYPIEKSFSKILDFLRMSISEIVKSAFFTQKIEIFAKIKTFSIEEHVLIELSISIDFIISFSSF